MVRLWMDSLQAFSDTSLEGVLHIESLIFPVSKSVSLLDPFCLGLCYKVVGDIVSVEFHASCACMSIYDRP